MGNNTTIKLMENKQTAVEWLINQCEQWSGIEDGERIDEDVATKAKEMEKQQMIEFAKGFWYYGNGSDAPPCYNEDVEKYYKKIYDGNSKRMG